MTPIIIDESLRTDDSPSKQEKTYEFVKSSTQPEEEPSETLLARKLEETKKFAEFLDARQDEINKRREALDEQEQNLRKRELELETEALKRQQEQSDEMRQELADFRAQELKRLNDEMEALQRELLDFRAQETKKLHADLEALRNEQIDKINQEMTRRNDELLALEKNLSDTKSEVEAERKKQSDDLWRELNDIRAQELKKLNDDIEALRQKQTDQLNRQLDEQIKSANQKRADLDRELADRREALSKDEQALAEQKAECERERKNLEFEKLRLKKLDETLKNRQAALDDEIQAGLDARHKEIEAKLDASTAQETDLLNTLRQRENELATFQNFRAVYGDTPEILRQKMDDLRNRNAALLEELGKRPGEELQTDYARLESECKRLQQERVDMNEKFNHLQEQVVELQNLRNTNSILTASNANLQGQWKDAQEMIDTLQARIDRLTAAEMTPADWDKRAASLREPYLTAPFNAPPSDSQDVAAVDEIDWLNRMENLFTDYGITFPRRILYAFHTSFKIANWSTLTVLAGVSGTGKSELPRLYSAFGGFNFITVPVQPNWDSQESMLGFFNSIDNKFDAQPVLRFLVECTEKYDNNMAIVLLDEMNLAHVEHYFADFLSKLETRRSAPENSVPEIFVNLGAGVKPYGLPLKRNVLWCGTMNQDETTKSLSDKVLDRGIVINFPRPRELKSRKGARALEIFCGNKNIFPMSVSLWNSWREKSIKLQGDQLKQLETYRHLLEAMNEHLSHAGRAIGHRVWQSIEHYVINYPTVRAAVKEAGSDLTSPLTEAIRVAVEDQIVQKVMPKLRGIETRGKSYENCLVPIRGLLNDNGFNLNDDFDRACEMGYGQFMWSSAEYIGNEAEQESGNDK